MTYSIIIIGVYKMHCPGVPQDGLHVLCVPCVVNDGMLVPVPELMVHSPLIGSLLCRYVSVAVWTP